ncbi:hypothetical protein RHMOL_Rhmol08G0318900 [Rhododendron molle]|uniref:Uncharacterized protein n=1 Tax=Rhododendron molle TaxID=49168 RepID=A0ACC0MVX3_RHOML|nr:hypothetical protein RHMOL_Rhmol08G0318900 [Rhododendron molle]
MSILIRLLSPIQAENWGNSPWRQKDNSRKSFILCLRQLVYCKGKFLIPLASLHQA